MTAMAFIAIEPCRHFGRPTPLPAATRDGSSGRIRQQPSEYLCPHFGWAGAWVGLFATSLIVRELASLM